MKYINILITLFLIVFLYFIGSQDSYSTIPVSEWIDSLYSKPSVHDNSIIDMLYTISIPIQISFLGILVALVSILVARTKISIKSYFKHISKIDWVLYGVFQYFITLGLSSITIFMRPSMTIMIWLVISNIIPLYCTLLFSKNLVRLDSKQMINDLLLDKIKNQKQTYDFFKDIYIPIFSDSIYESVYNILKEVSDNRYIEKEKLFDITKEFNLAMEKARL